MELGSKHGVNIDRSDALAVESWKGSSEEGKNCEGVGGEGGAGVRASFSAWVNLV
jgi:hypothetical protein